MEHAPVYSRPVNRSMIPHLGRGLGSRGQTTAFGSLIRRRPLSGLLQARQLLRHRPPRGIIGPDIVIENGLNVVPQHVGDRRPLHPQLLRPPGRCMAPQIAERHPGWPRRPLLRVVLRQPMGQFPDPRPLRIEVLLGPRPAGRRVDEEVGGVMRPQPGRVVQPPGRVRSSVFLRAGTQVRSSNRASR
jgi:hypothetical protein